ncbi:hypothetical protein B0H10DRAFT_1980898 [Mycena sp. CBHHK59/15]|nr:hypothetical protein B0H10DRAFT_1980898 [Mycena sp. CBHHK59/15]
MLPLRSVLRRTPWATRYPSGPVLLRHAPSRVSQRASYHLPTHPPTLGARIWFRPDGTPRSKLRGLVATLSLSGLLYATYSTLLIVEALDYEHYLLATLVHIQRVDADLAGVPLDDPAAVLAHFAALTEYFSAGGVPPALLQGFFLDLAARVPLREEVHAIVRDAAVEVHEIIEGSRGADATETAALVIAVVDGAMLRLVELAEDAAGVNKASLLRALQLKSQMTDKDAAKGYEILG